jgi:asparagine synthase (glutamine-hydrolysing)
MCGIAAIFSKSGKTEEHHREFTTLMMDKQHHRGQDNFSVKEFGALTIAFNRLALTDINKQQPASGQWVVYLNGEIYNYRDLGYTGSEVEVISKGLRDYGLKFINQLNGMFVIVAIHQDQVYIIRDRYGIKPIYYWDSGYEIVIASECKAITAHPEFLISMNNNVARQWLVFNNVLTDETLFTGIKKLEKGTIWHLNSDKKKKFWSWNFAPVNMDFNEAKKEVYNLLNESMISMYRPSESGVFVSGGVDSNIIRNLFNELPTFTACFDSGDESELAKLLANDKHTEVYFDGVYKLDKTIYHLEDLRVGASFSNYGLYQYASNLGCKVIYDGTGSDELFGGYPWRYTNPDYYSVVNRTGVDDDYCRGLFYSLFEDDTLENRFKFDAEYFLEGVLLVGDKLGMAHTIEGRYPFLDNALVDFCLQLPNELKNNKLLLKEAFRSIIPDAILDGKKKGFSSPDFFKGEGNQARKWSNAALTKWKEIYEPS